MILFKHDDLLIALPVMKKGLMKKLRVDMIYSNNFL